MAEEFAKVLANVAATLEYIASTRPATEMETFLARSMDYYHRALTISPQDDMILTDAALVLFKMFNFNHSMQLLERATAINPDNIVAWRRLSRAYIMMQRPAEAAEANGQIQRLGGGPESLDTLRTVLK